MIDQKPGHQLFSATVVSVAIQVGCLTFLMIFLALIAGLVLDRWLETLPLFTILFLVGSMPISWILIWWIVNRAKSQLTQIPAGTSAKKQTAWEDEDSDRDH